MSIQGGALEFDVLFNNGQIDRVLEETKRRIQGFSTSTVEGGEKMEAAYKSAAETIERGFQVVGNTISINQKAITELQNKYKELGVAAGEAFMKGKDDKYNQLTQQQVAIQSEISQRKQLIVELDKCDKELLQYNKDLEDNKNKVDNASNAQVRFRTQLLNVTNQMIQLKRAGKTNTDEFQKLTDEATRLQQAMGIVNTQIKTLANPNLNFQSVLQGLSGITAGFTVANGAIALFGDKNEDLQKTMMKIQALMSITMGLQSMYQLSLSTSAFKLGFLTKVQNLYSAAVFTTGKAFIKMGVSAGVARIAAQALMATLTLGLSVAIAGITYLVSKFITKAQEAQKATDEFNKKVAETAAEPIASINRLAYEWAALGDNIEAKRKYFQEHKKDFDALGESIDSVYKAEKLLSDPSHVKSFIDAQIAKAKAVVYAKQVQDKVESAAQKQMELDNGVKLSWWQPRFMYSDDKAYEQAIKDKKTKLKASVEKDNEDIKDLITKASQSESEAANALSDAGVKTITEYAAGTVGAIEKAIKDKKDALEGLKGDNKAYKKNLDETAALQKQLDAITGKENKTTKTEKDPFTKDLEEKKNAYQEYFKWVNAGYTHEAQQEFSTLLGKGKTYKEYLENRLKDTKLSKEEIHKLTTALAEETGKTIMEEFETSLQNQLANAKTIIEMIDIIKQKREELENTTIENDPLKDEKEKVLKKQNKDVEKQQQEKTKQLITEYSDYLDKKITLEAELNSDIQLLENRRLQATTYAERESIDQVIKNRKQKYEEDKENLLRAGYEATKRLIDLGQDTALLNISKKTFAWEADRQKAILEAQKQAAKNTLRELENMQKEAKTPEIAIEIEEIKLKVEELNAELEKIPVQKFQEILSGLQQITGALGNLNGEVGEIFQSIDKGLASVSQTFDFVNKEGKTTADYLSQAGNAISGIVDIINMVSAASVKRKQAEREFYQNQIALAHEYALALNEQLRIQSELSGSGFITDYAGKINDGFNALTDATKGYQDALGKLSEGKAKVDLRNAIDWGAVGKGAASGAAIGAAIASFLGPFAVVGAAVGGLVGGLVGLFGGKKKKDVTNGLLDVFPELVDGAGNLNKELAQTLINTNQVDDNTKQLIQNALDWADAVEKANNQIKEVVVDLAGDLGNNLKNAMVEAWKAGEEGSKRMFEAASESLGKFIQDLLYSTIFSQVFKDFEEDLVASLNQFSGDGDVVDDFDRLMKKMQEIKQVAGN